MTGSGKRHPHSDLTEGEVDPSRPRIAGETYQATMLASGCVIIPGGLRASMGWAKGTRLSLALERDGCVLIRLADKRD